MKSEKAEKSVIDSEVKVLLNLKSEYKQATGKDWTPGAVAAPASPVKQAGSSADENTILQKIASQGEKVRDLKAKKAAKPQIDAEVQTLLSLKAEYKSLTGNIRSVNVKALKILV